MSADTSAAQPNQKYNVSNLRIDLGERCLKRVTPTAYKTADGARGSRTPGANAHARRSSLVIGGPSIPNQRAKSRSGRSVAASSASKPVRSEVDDCIERNPDCRDPVPVACAHTHIASVLHIEAL